MSYATPEQFIRAFSEREARTLTDEDMTGFIDEEKLASALARASAQIDGYLVGRYRTPWPDSPGILVGYCCDIARYHLATDYRICSEEIQMRYRDAIRFLEKVAAGQVNLGRDTSGSVIQSSVQDVGLLVLSRRPPLTQKQVQADSCLLLLAWQWYGDYSRAAELQRLNPQLRDPNNITAGMVINAYAK
ncbi:TPA: DUF1320 domain-containing protein [Escherichia coli]|nr:DUF1320 domain-containing protein [Escherichia coli]HAN8174448.1 DUF1320 domain-containing protein [Escherichia coli]